MLKGKKFDAFTLSYQIHCPLMVTYRTKWDRYNYFALSFEELLDFYCNTELSESSDLATSWQTYFCFRYLFLKIIFSVAEFISINQTLWDT